MTSENKDPAGSPSNASADTNSPDMPKAPDVTTPPATVIGWTCPKCGTDIELLRDVCWNCLYNPSAC